MKRVKLGPFHLEGLIGQGGSSQIWQGIHLAESVPVAIKVFSQHTHDQAIDAFRNEAYALAGLEHPSIIKVFDYGRISEVVALETGGELSAGSPYLVMELAEGSLHPYRGALGWKQLQQVLQMLLQGLAHAHARAVIHRDIKPGNILLVGERSQVKLSDFGIAYTLYRPPRDKKAKNWVGTPAFMAPEQFAASWREYGPWTDLFALGCTAYAMLTGQPPFGQLEDVNDIVRAQLRQTPPPLPQELDVPASFERWLMKLMEKSIKDRFQRASDAAWALKELVEVEKGSAQSANTLLPQRSGHDIYLTDKIPLEGTLQAEKTLHAPPSFDGPDELTMWDDYDDDEAEAVQETPTRELQGVTESPRQEATFLAPQAPKSWKEIDAGGQRHTQLPNTGLNLFGMRTIPFTGRERERDRLWQLTHHVADTGQPVLCLLEGPAGSGKSRLAEWLCLTAHEAGLATPLTATHTREQAQTRSLDQMLARHLRCEGMTSDERLAFLLRRARKHGTHRPQLFQDLASVLSSGEEPDDLDQDTLSPFSPFQPETRQERHTIIARYLVHLSQTRPLIVYFDDIQWGLDALQLMDSFFAHQATQGTPILFLCTLREDQSSFNELEEKTLEALRYKAPYTEQISVHPLDEEEREEMIHHLLQLTPALTKQVSHWTEGLPLLAVQLVEDWVNRGLLLPSDQGYKLRQDAEDALPDSLHELWLSRLQHALQGLDQTHWLALELAATLGTHIDGQEWEEVCALSSLALSEQESSRLLTTLLKHQLIKLSEESLTGWWSHGVVRWSFVHGALRESLVRASKESGRWTSHNTCCVMMLKERTAAGSSMRQAQHLLHAEQWRDAIAPLNASIWEAIEQSDLLQGQERVQSFDKLLKQLNLPEDQVWWGELWNQRSGLSRLEGDFVTAQRWAQVALKQAEKHGWRTQRIRALHDLSLWAMRSGENPTDAQRWMEEAEALAAHIDNKKLLSDSRRIISIAKRNHGQAEEAVTYAARSYHDAQSLPDLKKMGQACLAWADALRQQTKLAEAQEVATQGLRHFTDRGSRMGAAMCHNCLGDLMRMQGDRKTAEHHYKVFLRICDELGSKGTMAGHINLGICLLEQGHFRGAHHHLQLGREQAHQNAVRGVEGIAHVGLMACAAKLENWDLWRWHADHANQCFESTGYADVDVPKLALLSAHMATASSQPNIASEAYTLAISQWRALGQEAEAAKLEKELASRSSDTTKEQR